MAARRNRMSSTSSYKFPCGLTASNRLVKAPLYEHLADFLGGPPNAYHYALYSCWSRYDWGMVVTGNVQVNTSHLTLGRDLIVPHQLNEGSMHPYKTLATIIKGPDARTIAIMQLSHAGRQSANFIGGRFPFERSLAPSAVAVGSHANHDDPISALLQSVLFPTPREMSHTDINKVVEAFVKGARLAHGSGFDGVELHVAHGYLLAQFLSPKSNKRQDEYSLESEGGLRLLHRIVDDIRATIPSPFIIGIKLNASDYLIDASATEHNKPLNVSELRALQHVLALASWGTIDFIDISGGDYENPEFVRSEAIADGRRQAFFAHFSQEALKTLNSTGFKFPSRPAIMLTGGLRTPNLVQSALRSGQADFLGFGRGSIVCPHIPEIMYQYDQGQTDGGDAPFGAEPNLSTPRSMEMWPLASVLSTLGKVKLIGASFNMAWYTLVLRHLAMMELHGPSGLGGSSIVVKEMNAISGLRALLKMFLWVSDTQGILLYSGLVAALLIFPAVILYPYIY